MAKREKKTKIGGGQPCSVCSKTGHYASYHLTPQQRLARSRKIMRTRARMKAERDSGGTKTRRR